MGYVTVSDGDGLTPSLWNANVRDQGVSVFSDATARDAAITSPTEGMMCALTTPNTLHVYFTGSWRTIAWT